MDTCTVAVAPRTLKKAPTGIAGLDELTGGGLPAGRPTLVCGGPGCGKTLLSTIFLIKGAVEYGEPGVFMTFEERADDLVKNVASLGYDLDKLVAARLLVIDYVRVERAEIQETGEYDLEGLFIRLGHAIDTIGAKRVVLDTMETLFGGLTNMAILRAELRRLLEWLKDKGVTAIITGERGKEQLTRHGLDEYISDCVILLDHRVEEQTSTRRLRVVKYRGSSHGTNEFPFLIDDHGVSVMPVTSAGLDHAASEDRVSSGIPGLDAMIAGGGYFRGSTVLVSGTAGSGKSSVAAHFADAACRRGERCLFFAFEESPSQILRNMRSIGLDLRPWVKRGLLQFSARRPSLYGLEVHLATMGRDVREFAPAAVVVDPISSLITESNRGDVHGMLLRIIDFLKSQNITALFTSLTSGNIETARTEAQVSSLMDSWLLLYNAETNGEHNRRLYLVKSRGMAHSNQVREFLLTDRGIELEDVYVGPEGILTGSAKQAQQAREKAASLQHRQEMSRRKREIKRRQAQTQAEITALRADLEATGEEARLLSEEEEVRVLQMRSDREAGQKSRTGAGAWDGESVKVKSGRRPRRGQTKRERG